MTKYLVTGMIGAVVLAIPGVASAQTTQADPFIGVSAGYHEFDFDDEVDIEGFDTGSPIIGVVVGVDVPLGEALFAGVEGNFHFGTDVVDNEYGASLRLGYMTGNGSKVYLRGGYQEVDFNLTEIVNIDLDDLDELDDFDTTEGDYLVGAGADFPIGAGALRVNLDTISFDTLRATAGYVLTF